MKPEQTQKQEEFVRIADTYKDVVAKVCSVYTTPDTPFADLYQEVMINLWLGMDKYRGESKISTWIYRLAINTCINWYRRNKRHFEGAVDLQSGFDIPDTGSDTTEQIKELYALIAQLNPIEKALITLWLDEKSYDEIAAILGISRANVATRLHRVKEHLSKLAEQ